MSLLAWYPLINNGNNQGLDNINLSQSGNIPFTQGKLGNAATFSANNSNRFTRPLFKETTNLSFCAWIKPISHTSVGYFFTNARADAANDGWGIGLMTNGKLRYCFGSYTSCHSDVIDDGSWHHVAMTIDENKLAKCYLDGNLIGSSTVATLPDYTEGQLFCIGAFQYNNSYIYPANAQIQDFRYYNHCLSTMEVKELAKGLCLHLPLNWGNGNLNMIVNSSNWMNKNMGNTNGSASNVAYISADVPAGEGYFTFTIDNSSGGSAKANAGKYFIWTNQFGTTTTDNKITDFLTSGETYTYSFYARASSDTIIRYDSIIESQTYVSQTTNGRNTNGNLKLTNQWNRYSVTFKWTSTGKLTCCFYGVSIPAGQSVKIDICGLKLEKGTIATPWMSNQKDTIYSELALQNIPIQDTSGYNRNANQVGISYEPDAPRGYNSVKFSANSNYIKIPSIYPSTGNKVYEFTTTIWAKTTTLNGTSPNIICLGLNNFWRFRPVTPGTKVQWLGLVGTTLCTPTYTGTINLIDGNWHHYALTFKNGIITCYVDGQQIGTTNYSNIATYLTCNNLNWYLSTYDITNENFIGSMSDCRIYATALSSNDIKRLFNTPFLIDNKGNTYCNNLVEV